MVFRSMMLEGKCSMTIEDIERILKEEDAK